MNNAFVRATPFSLYLFLAVVLSALPARGACPAGSESVTGLDGCYRSCPPGFTRTAACTCARGWLETDCGKYNRTTAAVPVCASGAEYWGGLCYRDKCEKDWTRTASCTCRRDSDGLLKSECWNYDKDGWAGRGAPPPSWQCPAGSIVWGGTCYTASCEHGTRTAACSCDSTELVTSCERFGKITSDQRCTANLWIAPEKPLDVTFLVTTDLHFGSNEFTARSHQIHVEMVNGMKTTIWPTGEGFMGAGQYINPSAVVVTGDLTAAGHEQQFYLFREYWELGRKRSDMPPHVRDWKGDVPLSDYVVSSQVTLPVWVGYGNHDVQHSSSGDSRFRAYLKERMGYGCGDVINFDDETSNYSWNWGKLHMMQLNVSGDVGVEGENAGLTTRFSRMLAWIRDDLARFASDGRPVIVFQHYGLSGKASNDFFATKPWGTSTRGQVFVQTFAGYNVIAMFAGHEHEAMLDRTHGFDTFLGSTGGQGIYNTASGIHAVRVTDDFLDVAYYEWCLGSYLPTGKDKTESCPNMAKGASDGQGPRYNKTYSLHKAISPKYLTRVDSAVHCSGDCRIKSGPGCDTRIGQCSFPRSSALTLCSKHPQCSGVVCNNARSDCQARDAAEVLSATPLQGFMSYTNPVPAYSFLPGRAIHCAGDCRITSGPGCDLSIGQCSFPASQARKLCSHHPQCSGLTCNRGRSDCQARDATEVLSSVPWAGFDSYSVAPSSPCAPGLTHYAPSAGGFCCQGVQSNGSCAGSICALDPTRSQGYSICPPPTACAAFGGQMYGVSVGGFCCLGQVDATGQNCSMSSDASKVCALDSTRRQSYPMCPSL